jgi:hypothetical protein
VNGPDRRAVLQARVALERSRLAQARRVLAGQGPGAGLLSRLAGDRFTTLLAGVQQPLDDLDRLLAQGRVGAEQVVRTVELQDATDRALSECLALAVGALAREIGLDDGACEEADLLVEDLADRIDRRLARPTVPGAAEQLHLASDVLRRRVPDHGLWDLPVTVHEFGHVVAHGLAPYSAVSDAVSRPVEEFLGRYDGARRRQAGELFADVFATYCLGPSYPCTLLLHRLDPAAAAVADEHASHPGDASRAFACTWTLNRMQALSPSRPYDRSLGQLEQAWKGLQQDAPAAARLAPGDRTALVAQLESCWRTLEGHLSALRYAWSRVVRELFEHLEDPSAGPPSGGYSRADVLNAAWLVRLAALTRGTATGDLERRARDLLEAVRTP